MMKKNKHEHFWFFFAKQTIEKEWKKTRKVFLSAKKVFFAIHHLHDKIKTLKKYLKYCVCVAKPHITK